MANSVPEAATLVASHMRSIGFPGARAHFDGSGVPVVEAYTITTVNKPAEILLDTVDMAPSDRAETVRLHLDLGSQVQSLMDSTVSKLTAVGERRWTPSSRARTSRRASLR